MNQKNCICALPMVREPIREGFSGALICSICNGSFKYPRQTPTSVNPKDEIEIYAGYMPDSFEKMLLKILLRIEKALLMQAPSVDGRSSTVIIETNKDKGKK
jgi:hypothetical protein